jgi:hypothetical protein
VLSVPGTHSDDEEPELRYRALVALKKETLPRTPPQRIWGGCGCGEPCSICGRSVESADLEMELEFKSADGGDAAREFHLHLRCFVAWEAAMKALAKDRD